MKQKKWRVLAVLSVIVAGLGLVMLFLARPSFKNEKQVYGVSFSIQHAEGIGLDWKEVYGSALDDLKIKNFRLAAYWNEIEPEEGQFDFDNLDFLLDEAESRDAKVILSIGRKLPRWPECHVPDWAQGLSELEQQEKVLEMLEVVVSKYETHPAIKMWQLENEPLLDFGHCPEEDREFLAREEAVVRRLSSKPVMVTDSGELNWWIDASKFGDVLGTTMYRTVHSARTNRPFSYDYIFPAWLYRAKARVVGMLRDKPVIISELQGEPWASVPWTEASAEERRQSLSPERLVQLQKFAARTQLPEAYFWGVEYWYWEKVKQNEPVFWETARGFFRWMDVEDEA